MNNNIQKDKEITKVVFRKFPEGDLIALFPELQNQLTGNGYIMSYQHVGQHSDAGCILIKELEKCSSKEYKDLKIELESLGYNLKVEE